MMRDGEVWTLHHGDRTIGRITIDDADFPWLEGKFEPLPGFEAFKPLFDRSLELVEDLPEAWESVYNEIETQLDLHSEVGPTAEFLLHIENDRAWFRWSDTPFDLEGNRRGPTPGPSSVHTHHNSEHLKPHTHVVVSCGA